MGERREARQDLLHRPPGLIGALGGRLPSCNYGRGNAREQHKNRLKTDTMRHLDHDCIWKAGLLSGYLFIVLLSVHGRKHSTASLVCGDKCS